MKTLLQKLVTPHPLTFDELYTVLTEVEAILNSRPITPMNPTNIEDSSLTPGHFLIGRPLKAPPTKPANKGKLTSLRRWVLMNRLTQDLWKTWIGCYLQSLHHRTKWTTPAENLKKDDLVFIKDETLRYRDWPMARVLEVYSGDDGKVRTAYLLCHGKQYRRSIHRLIPFSKDDTSSRPITLSPPEDVQDLAPEQMSKPKVQRRKYASQRGSQIHAGVRTFSEQF